MGCRKMTGNSQPGRVSGAARLNEGTLLSAGGAGDRRLARRTRFHDHAYDQCLKGFALGCNPLKERRSPNRLAHEVTLESASLTSLASHGHRRTDSAAPCGASHFSFAQLESESLKAWRLRAPSPPRKNFRKNFSEPVSGLDAESHVFGCPPFRTARRAAISNSTFHEKPIRILLWPRSRSRLSPPPPSRP